MATLLLRVRHFDERSLGLADRWNRATPAFLIFHRTAPHMPSSFPDPLPTLQNKEGGLALSYTSRR
jgi:hypothetical protein